MRVLWSNSGSVNFASAREGCGLLFYLKVKVAMQLRFNGSLFWNIVGLALLAAVHQITASAASNNAGTAQVQTMSSISRGESRNVFGYDPTPDFLAFDPQYRQKHAKYASELEELQLELARQTSKGRPTPCSRQLFLEARWLVFYSAKWHRIEKRLHDLREMLARPSDPADAREQIEADGSYDHCSEPWFLKLDSTIEEVEDRSERGEKIKYPLKLLDRINSPEKLRAYLDSLLVSDVRTTGMDNRFELNIAITAIERFIVGHAGRVYEFQPGLKQALFDYEDNFWQDPVTGYFGGWYRMTNGVVRKTADLSVTFHIASYRRESLKRLREMIGTTLAFRAEEYPFGWLQEGRQSNHHNYDVVRLIRIGWREMNDQQRELARIEFGRMMDFCLHETMNLDGSFKMMGLTDTESAKVLRRFDDARRERRGWWLGGILLLATAAWIGWKVVKRARARRRSQSALPIS